MTGARRDGGDAQLDEQLVRCDRRRERHDEEVRRGDHATPPDTDDLDLGAERRHDGRDLGCRICVRDAAADRAAVSDRHMADQRRSFGEQRAGVPNARIPLENTLADERSEPKLVAAASSMRSSPATRLTSTSTAGDASRRFRSGPRLWPPASTFASSPNRARRSQASSTVSGAW